jgi:hypothetical protein
MRFVSLGARPGAEYFDVTTSAECLMSPHVPLAGMLLLLAASPLAAQKKVEPKEAPKVLYSVPLVVKPGAKQKLAFRGRNLETVKEVKVGGVEGAKVRVLGAKKVAVGNNQPVDRVGDAEVEIELELPMGATAGATLTAISPKGESQPYTLLIGDQTHVMIEKEDNGGFSSAQAIALPAAVEGTVRVERDADVFRFEGKKGDKVRIEVQAASFGSPVDPLLTLSDARGRIVAAIDDVEGGADPVLSITLPRDGRFFISLIDAHDLGGPCFGYRMTVRKEK